MAANNSIARYTAPSKKESQDAAGITAFPTAASWNQIINGLVFQGGKIDAAGPVQFTMPLQKQLLGIFVSVGAPSGESKTGFTASAPCYWLAIGA